MTARILFSLTILSHPDSHNGNLMSRQTLYFVMAPLLMTARFAQIRLTQVVLSFTIMNEVVRLIAEETGENGSAEAQQTSGRESKQTRRKRVKKKSKGTAARKSAAKQVTPSSNAESGRVRGVRSFPAATFEEALVIAEAIQKFASGQQRVRKLTLFDKLGKTPDSGPSRQLITNSSRYGLTKGGYQAEFIELTSQGAPGDWGSSRRLRIPALH
jgi:hypothetical protein